jgi:hypothetical protein
MCQGQGGRRIKINDGLRPPNSTIVTITDVDGARA